MANLLSLEESTVVHTVRHQTYVFLFQFCGNKFLILVKNKILYRRAKLVAIQAAIRGYAAKKEYRPRIRGMMKIKTLYEQLAPMKHMVTQMKKDKDSATKKINSLEKSMDSSLEKIQVGPSDSSSCLFV